MAPIAQGIGAFLLGVKARREKKGGDVERRKDTVYVKKGGLKERRGR